MAFLQDMNFDLAKYLESVGQNSIRNALPTSVDEGDEKDETSMVLADGNVCLPCWLLASYHGMQKNLRLQFEIEEEKERKRKATRDSMCAELISSEKVRVSGRHRDMHKHTKFPCPRCTRTT